MYTYLLVLLMPQSRDCGAWHGRRNLSSRDPVTPGFKSHFSQFCFKQALRQRRFDGVQKHFFLQLLHYVYADGIDSKHFGDTSS